MKRHILSTLLLFFVVQVLVFAQNNKADSSLFPLSVGNKYYYINEYSNINISPIKEEHRFSIDSITITSSKMYNSILYYKYGDSWITYNNSDSTIHNLPGTTNMIEWDLSPLGKPYNIEFLGNTNICYCYVLGGWTGAGTTDNMYAYFAPNIGIVASGYNNVTHSYARRSGKTLIATLSTDSINGFIKQDPASPIFDRTTISRITNTNSIKISSIIKHKFSHKTDPSQRIMEGCSFIKNVMLEFFYKKGTDESPHQFSDLNMDSEINFSCIVDLNMDLINNGYKLHYKIVATDKAIIPHTTYYPQTGFAELDFDSLGVYSLNYYPLQVGNYWVYNNYKVKVFPPLLTLLSQTTIKVTGVKRLSNGKNYFTLLRDNSVQYERIDTLSGILYSATVKNGNVVEKALCYLYADEGSNYLINRPSIAGNFTTYYKTTSNFSQSPIPTRNYVLTTDTSYNFSLLKDIGLYSERSLISTGYNNYSVLVQYGNSYTDENNAKFNYYPLKIGNYWFYDRYEIKDTQKIFIDRNEAKVVGDTTIPSNNKQYFIVKRGDTTSFERIDSVSGIVYSAHIELNNQIKEESICSLYDENGRVQSFNRNGTQDSFSCLNDSINVFNNYLVASKNFTGVNNNSNSFTICKGIGLYTENYSSNGSNYLQELKYAKIDTTSFGSKISSPNILNRLPLNIGDEFIYERSIKPQTSTSFNLYDTLTIKIEKDTILSNNLNYFKMVSKENLFYIRIDSVYGNIYKAQFNDNNTSDVLTDNLYTSDNQTLQISFFDKTNVFRYSNSNSTNNLECITAVSTYDSKNYFTRCLNVGIIEALGTTLLNDEFVYIYYNLIGAKIGNGYWRDYEFITGKIPTNFDLSQNYPNPFNPSTTINYSIPQEGLVKIKVFDILGREVTQLVNSQLHAGTYKAEFNSAGLASGVYIYSLFVDNNLKSSKKMILVK